MGEEIWWAFYRQRLIELVLMRVWQGFRSRSEWEDVNIEWVPRKLIWARMFHAQVGRRILARISQGSECSWVTQCALISIKVGGVSIKRYWGWSKRVKSTSFNRLADERAFAKVLSGYYSRYNEICTLCDRFIKERRWIYNTSKYNIQQLNNLPSDARAIVSVRGCREFATQ